MPDLGRDLRPLESVVDSLPSAGVVDLHGVRSALLSADPTARRALAYVFGNQAQVLAEEPPAPDEWRVACIRSDDLYDVWSRAWESPEPPPVEITRWDGDSVALRADWPGGVSVVRHSQPFVGLTVFAEPLRLAAYVLPEDERLSIHHLEHLLKYTLRVRCWGAGGVEVHAATCVYRDRGLLLMGTRRSGKTTLAMHVVSRGGFLLGSDLALLRDGNGDGLGLRAIPAVCRIAPEAVADNTRLREGMAHVSAGDDYLNGPVFFDEKYELYPPALDAVFGHPVSRAAASADLVVFPRFSVERTRQRVAWLEPETASELIRGRLVADKPLPDWLPFREVLARSEIEAEWIDRLVTGLPPVAEIEFGREETLDWEQIDELVESLE